MSVVALRASALVLALRAGTALSACGNDSESARVAAGAGAPAEPGVSALDELTATTLPPSPDARVVFAVNATMPVERTGRLRWESAPVEAGDLLTDPPNSFSDAYQFVGGEVSTDGVDSGFEVRGGQVIRWIEFEVIDFTGSPTLVVMRSEAQGHGAAVLADHNRTQRSESGVP